MPQNDVTLDSQKETFFLVISSFPDVVEEFIFL